MTDRNKKALEDKRIKEEQKKTDAKYSELKEVKRLKHKFITNLINGRFWLSRCNMIATQVSGYDDSTVAIETIDGVSKTKEFLMSEYASFKLLAIDHMREAHFLREDILQRNVTPEELDVYVADYYEGKIIRETWDPDSRPNHNAAEFKPYETKDGKIE